MLVTPKILPGITLENIQEILGKNIASFNDLYIEHKRGIIETAYTSIFDLDFKSSQFDYPLPGGYFRYSPMRVSKHRWSKVLGKKTYNKHSSDSIRYCDIMRRVSSFPYYGIVDSPQQFIDKYSFIIARSHLPLCVFLQYAGTPSHGFDWRWHKHGTYLGEQGEPSCEYFKDEQGFEKGVYFYSVELVNT